MKYIIFFSLCSTCLFSQDYKWLKMSQEYEADTLFLRFDSTTNYVPLRFDHVSEDGKVDNMIHKVYSAKRDINNAGIIFYYSDYKSDFGNSIMYIKHRIEKDTVFGINWGSYWSLYDSPKGTQPWILADASTEIVPHRDPKRT